MSRYFGSKWQSRLPSVSKPSILNHSRQASYIGDNKYVLDNTTLSELSSKLLKVTYNITSLWARNWVENCFV